MARALSQALCLLLVKKLLLMLCVVVLCRFEKVHPAVSASVPRTPTTVAASQSVPARPLRGPFLWGKRATLPGRYSQACDLESAREGLLIAASADPLTRNGAVLFELSSQNKLTELLRWDGQGFRRDHSYGDQVAVPDADAPFGLGFLLRCDVDGFVFFLRPGEAKKVARAVIPTVYHVFDTALLNGRLYASTGAYVPGDIPYRSSRARRRSSWK